jgi:hypothetical protein
MRWGRCALVLVLWGALTGCESFDKEFKSSFSKEFKSSCLSSSTEAGASAGDAKTYCDCMGDGLVKKHTTAELTGISVKLTSDPAYTLDVADKIGCTASLQPVFKASFNKSFVESCLGSAPNMKEYCECYSSGLSKRHDARGLMNLSTELGAGKIDPTQLARDLGCLPSE